jgi:hypothetical protein
MSIIFLFNIPECRCNKLGTEVCNHNTGDCACLPGVEGELCDQCQADHWGFESGQPVRSIQKRLLQFFNPFYVKINLYIIVKNVLFFLILCVGEAMLVKPFANDCEVLINHLPLTC